MDVLAYALLALDVLLLALVLCWLGRAAYRAVRRYRRRGRTPELVVRRCDACRLAWKGEPDVDYGRVELLARRRERRRARAQARPAKGWAKARGWNRCPGCLSTRVRTSGDGQTTEETKSRLSAEAVGWVVSGVGAVLLAVAVVGYAASA